MNAVSVPEGRLRVLMISKALVIGTYQRKPEEIALHPGIDLTVIAPAAWRDARGLLPMERAYTRGYTLLALPIGFNGNFHLHYYPGLSRWIAALRPHIVHIDEEPYNLAAYQALRLAQRAGARALFFSWQNLQRHYPPPFNWMERAVLRGVVHAIAGTQDAADVWRAKGYAGPLSIIPQFGVDPEIFSPASQPCEDDILTIGYAGRLVEEKGLAWLIRALARVPGRTHLRLAGDGPQRADLLRLAGLHNIGGSVELIGPLSSTDMPDFYRSLDVLVLPSLTRPNWKEQFGRVLIEAMSCGIPVIGSNSGAIPGVIGQAGIIVPEGDIEALSSALASLASHRRLREQMAQAGRDRVLAHFTQTQIAAQTVAVYSQMASAGSL